MKIAVDMRMSGKSGIGTFLDELIPYFKESGNEFYFSCPDVKTFSIKEMFCFPKEELKKINSCDAYFTPYCNIPGGIKIPVYSTIHDVVFLDVKGLAGKAGTAIRKFFYSYAIKRSKAVFTVSQFSKERIIANLKCKKPIHVVHNGTPSYYDNVVSCKNKGNYMIFIGNIKKHKGLSVLLEAFEFILQSRPDVKLMIVGSNENFRSKDDSINSKIEKINFHHKDAIQFTGFVENEKLKELLARAKLLVQPSLYEGFGIPPLQALKCGTNAVISDIPVFKEIYGQLPVTFFKNQDSSDLKDKILETLDKDFNSSFTEIYSYRKTAEAILKVIENN